MAKLRILIAVLLLTVVLVAAYGVAYVGATDPGREAEARLERQMRDADFLRHNYDARCSATRAEATLKSRMLSADFLRHNYDTRFSATNAGAALKSRMQSIDFIRHNYAANQRGASLDATKPTPNLSDQQRIAHRQNKR